jgi:Fe-S oxidoreductase
VGVGKCRREEGGTMCPSWRVTHDERHTTRGRAHLLHEMLRGDSPVAAGWKSEAVKDALDLCLSCKGCKHDCPMGVDVATYKAEFLAHHYEGRLRPRAAYTLGRMHRWARVASRVPNLANLAMRIPGAKWVAGVHPARPVPAFATTTFRAWARRHRAPVAGREVIVWADSWTEHFHPEIGRAAVRVLEGAGFRPRVIQRWVCCGRPLYDYGLLDEARAQLRACIEATAPYPDAPIVVLEPSCASVFRDEMPNLLGDDARPFAARVVTLAELLDREAPLLPGRVEGPVVFHGHCHEKAVLDGEAAPRVLRRMGADVTVLDDGCCGMAGSFGFEVEKYDVSVAIAEKAFLPAMRGAGVVVTDGFSCRTQAEHLAGKRTWHLAEILERALDRQAAAIEQTRARRSVWRAIVAAVVGVIAAGLAWVGLRRR